MSHRDALKEAVLSDDVKDVLSALKRFPHDQCVGLHAHQCLRRKAHDDRGFKSHAEAARDHRSLADALTVCAGRAHSNVFDGILGQFLSLDISEDNKLRDLHQALLTSAFAGQGSHTDKLEEAIKNLDRKLHPGGPELFRALRISIANLSSADKPLRDLSKALSRSADAGQHAHANQLLKEIKKLDLECYHKCTSLLRALMISTAEGISDERTAHALKHALAGRPGAKPYAHAHQLLEEIKKLDVRSFHRCTGLFRALLMSTVNLFPDNHQLCSLQKALDRSAEAGRHAHAHLLWEEIKKLDPESQRESTGFLRTLISHTVEISSDDGMLGIFENTLHENTATGSHGNATTLLDDINMSCVSSYDQYIDFLRKLIVSTAKSFSDNRSLGALKVALDESADARRHVESDKLLDKISKLDVTSYHRCSGLLRAYRNNTARAQVGPILDTFVKKAKYPPQRNRDLRPLLVSSAQHGHLGVFQLILKRFLDDEVSVEQQYEGIRQALLSSCQDGHFAIIYDLLRFFEVLDVPKAKKAYDCYHATKRLSRAIRAQHSDGHKALIGNEEQTVHYLLNMLCQFGNIPPSPMNDYGCVQTIPAIYHEKYLSRNHYFHDLIEGCYTYQHHENQNDVAILLSRFLQHSHPSLQKASLCRALKAYSQEENFEAVHMLLGPYLRRGRGNRNSHEGIWDALSGSKFDSKVRNMFEDCYRRIIAKENWFIVEADESVILFDIRFENQDCHIESGDKDCPICYQTLIEGLGVTRFPCGHWFCAACTQDALLCSFAPLKRCPFCRKGFVLADIRRIYQLDSHITSP